MARSSTPRSAPRSRKPSVLVVNLDEFASLCGVTPETMRSHLKTVPTEAEWIIERGRRGVGYKIAAAGGVAWWRARAETGGGVDDERLAQLAELRLQMLGDAGEDEGLNLTGKQRYEEYRAGQAELEYRELIGELCRVAEIEGETSNAVIELRRQLLGIGPAIRREFGLDPKVGIAIEEAIGAKLAAFVAAIGVDIDVGAG